MQTTNTVTKHSSSRRPVSHRRGIRLDRATFARAIAKAESVKPKVVNIGAHYGVSRSDGGMAIVVFRVYDGAIWGACNCPAADKALPCYHIAAAALSRKARGERVGDGHAVGDEPETHTHYCRQCGELYECGAPGCAGIDDLQCAICEAAG